MTEFPSEPHRQSLLGAVERGGFAALNGLELLQFHAYRYAWRRVKLGDFTQTYGCDPRGDHFDGVLVGQAMQFYGWKPRPAARPAPTPEDIAHVEAKCREFRANLAGMEAKNRAAFAEPSSAPMTAADLEIIKAGLGLGAHEAMTRESEDVTA